MLTLFVVWVKINEIYLLCLPIILKEFVSNKSAKLSEGKKNFVSLNSYTYTILRHIGHIIPICLLIY